MEVQPFHSLAPLKHPARQRVLLIVFIVGYVALFQWIYKNYLFPNWDYFGFDYNLISAPYLILAWALSVSPSLWMPMEIGRPSQLAYWVLYITVYIPSMFVPLFVNLDPPADISRVMLALFAGFAVMGAVYLLPILRLRKTAISTGTFWMCFGIIAAALTLWIIVEFHSNLKIVSFNNVYDLRDSANDIAEGGFVNFAFMLLTGAFNPFLMAWGLYHRRRVLFLAGALGQLLIYSVGGTKGSILSILFVGGFYFLFRWSRHPFALKFMFGTLGLAGTLCLLYVSSGYDPTPFGLIWIALFVVLMRTLSANALMTAWYYNFFQSNPHTFYSHVRGISWFVHFPYQQTVALEIGTAYIGGNGADPTAHFWAIDGIGAMGLPGVLLVSALCAFVFWILDSASQRHDPRLAALVTCYAAYNIANISLFTSVYSGGLGLLIVALYLMPVGAMTYSTKTNGAGIRSPSAIRASGSSPPRGLENEPA